MPEAPERRAESPLEAWHRCTARASREHRGVGTVECLRASSDSFTSVSSPSLWSLETHPWEEGSCLENRSSLGSRASGAGLCIAREALRPATVTMPGDGYNWCVVRAIVPKTSPLSLSRGVPPRQRHGCACALFFSHERAVECEESGGVSRRAAHRRSSSAARRDATRWDANRRSAHRRRLARRFSSPQVPHPHRRGVHGGGADDKRVHPGRGFLLGRFSSCVFTSRRAPPLLSRFDPPSPAATAHDPRARANASRSVN